MHYRLNKGDMTLPSDWSDETLYVFKSPDSYNLVINTDTVPPGVSSEAHLKEQLQLFKDNLPDYDEISRQAIAFAGGTWPFLVYSWTSPESKMYQANLMYITEGILTSFTFSNTEAFDDAKMKTIQEVLKSYEPLQEQETTAAD